MRQPGILAIGVLLLVIALIGAIGLARPARAQDGTHGQGHGERHDWYRTLEQPGTGLSCCSGRRSAPDGSIDGDCRPTRAFVGDDGRWRAMIDGRWQVVPPHTVLDPSLNQEALYPHVCASTTGLIYCFLPGASGG
ncbi:MAG: hypothetical protein U1E60_00475 [Reyranellaceae bacterium]